MKYSITVEYALHSLFYLVERDAHIGLKDLAAYQGLPVDHLAKVFNKLSKYGIVSSVPGVKGGYKLAKQPEIITMLDIVQAIEGEASLFQCQNILKCNINCKNDDAFSCEKPNARCTINQTMLEAERQMNKYLENKTLLWLYEETNRGLRQEVKDHNRRYFSNH